MIMKKMQLVILFLMISSAIFVFGEDLSSLNRDWDKAEVKWNYNPWRLLILDFVPAPAVSIDGDKYYGYVSRVGSSKNIYGETTVYSANLLLPKELRGNRYIPDFYNDYKETQIGTKLSDLTGDSTWYNWESMWRHSGVPKGTMWTFAGSISFKMVGMIVMGFAPLMYYGDENSGMSQEDMYKMVGMGAGFVLSANLIDILERIIRGRKYQQIADTLND
jgi:hypothetical protein